MPMEEFQANWKIFTDLAESLPKTADENINQLFKRYIDQNIVVLNEIFNTSIENLQALQKAETANEIICMHAKFTTEISNKLALSAQRFMNSSLGHIADYNEWLKLHCDLATD